MSFGWESRGKEIDRILRVRNWHKCGSGRASGTVTVTEGGLGVKPDGVCIGDGLGRRVLGIRVKRLTFLDPGGDPGDPGEGSW